MIATVISGVFSAILAFIFNLHDLVEMLSIGTLLAYTIVALCVLILRYQPETISLVRQNNSESNVGTETDSKEIENEDSPLLAEGQARVNTYADSKETSKENWLLLGKGQARQASQRTASLALAAIVTSCSGFAGLSAMVIWGSQDLLQAKEWAITVVILIGLVLKGSIMLLVFLPQNNTPLSFKVPCVPILPLVSVFINVFLILKLSYLTWIRFAVWMFIGEFKYRLNREPQVTGNEGAGRLIALLLQPRFQTPGKEVPVVTHRASLRSIFRLNGIFVSLSTKSIEGLFGILSLFLP